MTWLRTIAAELWGLFVDDGRLALLAIMWVAVIGLAVRYYDGQARPGWSAILLFGGLAAIYLSSVVDAARLARRDRKTINNQSEIE